MLYRYRRFVLLIIVVVINFSLSFAQGLTPKLREQMVKADSENTARTSDERKIRGPIYHLLRMAELADSSIEMEQKAKESFGVKSNAKLNDSNERLDIVLGIRSREEIPNVVAMVESLGGKVLSKGKDIGYVNCNIPIKVLRQLISVKSIVGIDLMVRGTTKDIVSLGNSQLKADSVKSQYMAYGDGVAIGVISNGVDHLDVVKQNFELQFVTVLNAGSGDEGTAMLEIVHDLAPNANLYFCGAGYDYYDFAQAVKALDIAGCKIIVDDIEFLDEPYFTDEDDTLGIVIRNFLWRGGVFVSAGGNRNYSIYNTPSGLSIYSGKTNVGPDNFNIFPNNQTFIELTVQPSSIVQPVYLEWATPWKHPTCDYDIIVYNENGSFYSQGNDVQTLNGGVPPREYALIVNNGSTPITYKVSVLFKSGSSSPIDFKIICNPKYVTLNNTYSDNRHIFGHCGYPNVIGVAAYNAAIPTQLATYSSGGPLRMYSTVANAWSDLNEPYITATSGVSTYVGSAGYWKYDNGTNVEPFYGTSAAAPHIAAIAGLYFSYFPTRTREDFMNDLKLGAVSIESKGGGGTWDARAGYGKASAMGCFTQALGNVATPVFSPISQGIYSTNLPITMSTATSGAQIRYTTNNTEPTITSTLYTSTITLSSTTTLKAKAFKSPLQPSLTQTQTYTFASGVRIVQVDTQKVAFGKVQIWSGAPMNIWRTDYDEGTLFTSTYSNYIVSAYQDFRPGTLQKYNRWIVNSNSNSPVTLNPTQLNINRNQNNDLTAYFNVVYNATIQSQLTEANSYSDSIFFKDPWMIDSTSSWANHVMNRDALALFKPISYSLNNLGVSSINKGIFLNQATGTGKPYYSVKVPLTRTINGRQYYFQNWTSTKATLQQLETNPTGFDQKAVVFTDSNAIITANYKGTHFSDNSSAFANNGQRKLVKTTDGNLHMVYESMGHVWYEMSTDNGSTWTIANNNKPLDTNGGKLPAIDSGGDNIVVIVWEEKNGGALQLKIGRFQLGVMSIYYPLIAFDDINQAYSQNLNPVIAYDYESRAVIAWENKGSSVYPVGIVVKHGPLGSIPTNPPTWASDYAALIPSTDINCANPTISVSKNPIDQYNMYYYLSWQYNQSAGSSLINYCRLTANSGGVSISAVTNISSGNGYVMNYRPSIVATTDTTARVCWIGDATGTGSNVAAIFKDPTYSRFWYFGNKVVSTSMNISNDAYCPAWSQNTSGNNYVNQYTDSHSLSIIKTLNTTGKDIQLSNGQTESNMVVSSFSPFTAPYFFTTSNSLSATAKINPNAITSGRGGVISKNGAQFFYSFGDLTVDNNIIGFAEAADSTNYNVLNNINSALVTKPFTVNNNSTFTFSECSGMIDSLTALSALGDSGYVSFKAELVDNTTNNVIGIIRDSRLSSGELHSYNVSSYNLSTDGLSGKTVKVKITLGTNLDGISSALTDKYADASSISKSTIKTITLKGPAVIKEYALEQNYPNPFNPTTVISYQVPKDGLVTVKVYDILGSEVKTLTNGYRAAGKYSVSFDASKLASGVYLYQLRSNGFVSTKKMMLLK